ncbi:TPA: fimbrial protein [Salmonella enterica subsp. enterica serovar Poona]|nr:fimbrial protein [Salmonella enterica subsp. enterica serovar Poona]
MKKTLIALAVAASAVVSGSAMAWTANGTGGDVELGGTLTPVTKVTPWEVQVGAAVTGLNADIQKGQRAVDIVANKAIPVLGIRTISNTPFQGKAGISPQIDYGKAVDVNAFADGRAPLTLQVKDNQNVVIGTLTAKLGASALISIKSNTWSGYNHAYAGAAGHGFFGGLPKTKGATPDKNIAYNVMPEVAEKFTKQGTSATTVGPATAFNNTNATYSAYYAAGIEKGQSIKIALDTPAQGDAAIAWTASMPVIVTYQ